MRSRPWSRWGWDAVALLVAACAGTPAGGGIAARRWPPSGQHARRARPAARPWSGGAVRLTSTDCGRPGSRRPGGRRPDPGGARGDA